MSSASPSPAPEPIKQKKKSKDKSKKKAGNPDVIITGQGKDEGTNPYVPPEGTILLEHDVDSGEFDWDAVKNEDDIELWLVRVPEGVGTWMVLIFLIFLRDCVQVKPKYLENVKIDVPSSSRSATVGVLNRKHRSYDIWLVGDDDGQLIGGEEIRGLSCLLPRKKKNGKLYQGI
jgi:hypothetical protein